MESVTADSFMEFELLVKKIKGELKFVPKELSLTVDVYIPEIIEKTKEMECFISKASGSLRPKDTVKWSTYKRGKELLSNYLLTSNPTDHEVRTIFKMDY